MNRIIVFSGAGLSAESGLQTFRDTDGLWNNHRVEEVADINTWERNFNLVHNFYNDRRHEVNNARPNAAHQQIAEWQEQFSVINITQNIDNLLERAGCQNVVHLHGVHDEVYCMDCGNLDQIDQYDFKPCRCGSKRIKPNIVFFGENAPKYNDLFDTVNSLQPDDIIIVVGTSNKVINFNAYLYGRPGLKFHVNPLHSQSLGVYDYEITEPATKGLKTVNHILVTL